ncbi:hypothetical protein MMC34_008613 [Xylographa carneopallida]|nr:hypothetical protein [Xylographa carneopallida]
MSGVDSGNAPPSLTPAVLGSLTSQPAAAEWLMSHAQHHILYHQQQLLYWTSFHNELAAVRKAQHAAASIPPASSSSPSTSHTDSAASNGAPLSSPTAVGKSGFMSDLAARLGAGPPARSRANSASAPVAEDSSGNEQQSPVSLDRSPSSLTHPRKPGSKKNVKATPSAAFKAQGGFNRASSNDSEAGASADGGDGGKDEDGQDEEKAVAVSIPVAQPVHEVGAATTSSSHHTAFAASSVSYVPIIQPGKGQVPPPVPRSGATSPAASTPPSPSSAAMVAANRRPPPVPPGGKSGASSAASSQPSSPIVKSKPPVLPPVPAHDLAATSMAYPLAASPAPPTPSAASSVPAFQPRSLPQAPKRAGGGVNTPSRGTPTTSPNSTADASSLPPPVPDLPVTSSSEDYLAAVSPLAAAPPNADGSSAESTAPAPTATVGNRLGGIGGFKLPGPNDGDSSDWKAKLIKKREAAAAEAANAPPPAAATAATVTTTTTTTTSSTTSPVSSRTSASTSPNTRRPVASPAAPAPIEAAVGPCGKCGCTDFKQNAFQKGKCNNCFHPHGHGQSRRLASVVASAERQARVRQCLLFLRAELEEISRTVRRLC